MDFSWAWNENLGLGPLVHLSVFDSEPDNLQTTGLNVTEFGIHICKLSALI